MSGGEASSPVRPHRGWKPLATRLPNGLRAVAWVGIGFGLLGAWVALAAADCAQLGLEPRRWG